MSSDDFCFVMQPFDSAKFDKRYQDIFEPALRVAGVTPYRVDKDLGVVIPIEAIETQIRNARICFAEVTTDNPNVWFELGYAIACKKEIVLVSCTNERPGAFPFDVRHRSVITYDTDSPSSYSLLEKKITEKAKSFLDKQGPIISIDPEVVETKGLSIQEIIILGATLVSSLEYNSGLSISEVQVEMMNHGYDPVAGALAIKKLLIKEMIKEVLIKEQDRFEEYEYKRYVITALGDDWLLKNEDKIVIKKTSNKKLNKPIHIPDEDDLPF